MVAAIIIAAVLVAITTLTVWTHESRRQDRLRDEIKQTVRSAVLSAIARLSTGEEEITSISVLECLRDMGTEIDVTAVLVALDAQVSEGHLERFVADGQRWFYQQMVTYRVAYPPLFPVAVDEYEKVEARVTYEAVATLNTRGQQAFAVTVSALTGLGDRRTRKLLAELTSKRWLEEHRVTSTTSKDMVVAYRCVPLEGTADM
jgi:hypothetical protein